MTRDGKIKGYKSFAFNYTNQVGEIMEEGHTYHCDGPIKYNSKGYHMSKYFEDTIAFSDLLDENGNRNSLHDVVIAEVIGSGEISEIDEYLADYYGFVGFMYACSDIEIVRFIPRPKLINMALNLNSKRLIRFVSDIRLSEIELNKFKGLYPEVDIAIQYSQERKKDAYLEKNKQKVYSLYYNHNKKVI